MFLIKNLRVYNIGKLSAAFSLSGPLCATFPYILPVNNRKQLDVSMSERICRICDEGVIGDEIHFLFECPKLEDLRIKYMALGDRMRPNVYNFQGRATQKQQYDTFRTCIIN